MVRVPFSGSGETFGELVSVCPVPLVALGGAKKPKEKDFLEMVHAVMKAGAFGMSAGRNIFQYKKPGNMIKAISGIVHQGFDPATAMKSLREDPIESTIFGSTPIW